LFLLFVLLASCGGGDGGATPDDTRGTDTAVQVDAAGDASDVLAVDSATADVTPTFHAIADPPTPGTYVLTTDPIELTVNVTDGRLFVLRAKVGCQGAAATPCVYERSIPLLTCSTSYEKGYTALLADNHAVVPIKEDSLELWVTAAGKLEGFYNLTPSKCCEAHPVVALTHADSTVCEGYETPDCDPYTVTGCAEGQHCIFDSEGRPTCQANGPTALGGACDMGAAACAEGACIDLSGTGSRCYRYCKSGGVECGGLGCLSLTSSSYKVCQLPASAFEPCDPLAPACAKANEACYLSGITTAPICQAAGDIAEGDACKDDNSCARGLLCVNQACRGVCRVGGGAPDCADAFAICQQVAGSIGVCVVQ